MQRFLFLITILMSFFPLSGTASAECGLIRCWNECGGGYQLMEGDRCESIYDRDRSCYLGYATCSEPDPTPRCGLIECWNECGGGYKLMEGDRCNEIWDSEQSCRLGYATCSLNTRR
jgi:hypothetical protein